MLKVVAFDLFGTVFDLQDTPQEEIRAYIHHVLDSNTNGWKPLTLPDSWLYLQPFPDVEEGLELLRDDFLVVTLSNAPLMFQHHLLQNAGLSFDRLIPLEVLQVYKPHLEAYRFVPAVMRCKPEEVLMVTGNENSPDVAGATAAGLQAIGIRRYAGSIHPDIPSLARALIAGNVKE